MSEKLDFSLIKRLTRIFSGPIVRKNSNNIQKIKRRYFNRFNFQVTPWNFKGLSDFQRNEYRIFDNLTLESLNDRARIMRYLEYEQMETMPEIARALTIYADESTTSTHLQDVLKIESSDSHIKEVLHNLFYNTLNIKNNLHGWVRQAYMYGDYFQYLHLDDKLGVVWTYGLPEKEIRRVEGLDPSNPDYVKFRWEGGNSSCDFENFQIVHYRIPGNERNYPYGTSVLEPSRRIFRDLTMQETVMMSYRIARSPERRVIYVDVAGLPQEAIPTMMENAKNAFKRNMVISPEAGEIHARYNPAPVHFMTPIPLLDGRTITIKQLSEEYEQGKENWVYSVQDDTHAIVPGLVKWCGKNYNASKIAVVTLDNGGVVKTAPEHPFVMRDGSSKRADELVPGDSLMPLYTRISESKDPKHIAGYSVVYDPYDETDKYMHRIVAENLLKEEFFEVERNLSSQDKYLIVHHKDFNKLNNVPSNLEWMGNATHSSMHGKFGRDSLIRYNKSELHSQRTIERNKRLGLGKKLAENYNGTALHKEHNQIRREAQKKSWAENKQARSRAIELVIPDECIEFGKDIYKNNPSFSRDQFISAFREDKRIISILTDANLHNNRDVVTVSRVPIERKLKELGYSGFVEYKNDALGKSKIGYKNHKVASVQIIEERADVYCMTVVGPNGENDRHNFGVSDYNTFGENDAKYCNTLVFVKNSIEDDYMIPINGKDSATKIEQLPGGQYVGVIDDIKYLRNKLFCALGIPSAYLEDKEGADDKDSLSQKDVRFAATVGRLQANIVDALEKIAEIHLLILGYRGEDLVNFKLMLNIPSKIWELQELEFWRTKLDIVAAAEGKLSSKFTDKKFLGLNDEEIRENRFELYGDAKRFASIEKIKAAASGDMGGMGGLGGDMGGLGGLGGDMGDLGGDMGGLGDLGGDIMDQGAAEAGEEAPDAGALLAMPGSSRRAPRASGAARDTAYAHSQHSRVAKDERSGSGPRKRENEPERLQVFNRGARRALGRIQEQSVILENAELLYKTTKMIDDILNESEASHG